MLDRFENTLVAVNRWLLILMLMAMAVIVFSNVVPTPLALALRVLVVLVIAIFCLSMTWFSLSYTMLMRFQTTPATGISFAWIYAALPAGFLLLLVHLALVVRRYVRDGSFHESPEMDAEAAASL